MKNQHFDIKEYLDVLFKDDKCADLAPECQEMKWLSQDELHLILRIRPASSQGVQKAERFLGERLKERFGLSVRVIWTSHHEAGKPAQSPSGKVKAAPFQFPHIKHVVLVGSGKGGVGKSTVTSLLAHALRQQGQRVGVLDADLYGPSLHHLFNVSEKPASPDGKVIAPIIRDGIALMSMGTMIPQDKAAVWRGPMIHHALRQMLFQVAWPELDILLIDLPPGTGDIPLSLAQMVKTKGMVVVSTAHMLSIIDVRRAISMCRTLSLPVLGMVENMSHFTCPSCHTPSTIFEGGGVRAEAQNQEIPFLGSLPLSPQVQKACDTGTLASLFESSAPCIAPCLEMAHHLLARLEGV